MKIDYTHYDQDKQINNAMINYYLDLNYKDRSKEVTDAFKPTLQDIKEDPEFYAELVTDLMYHWVYGTRETPLMNLAKKNLIK